MAALESVLRYRWVILALAFVSQMTTTLAAQVVPPLAPLLQAELGLSKVEIGFFSSAAFAGSWGVLLVAGYLTDRFGVRRMMALGQIVAGAVMMTMSLVGSFVQAAAVMFTVGLCRGTVHPGASKAIMDWFPVGARATAMGVKQTGYPVAGILMASTLPVLALAMGWRAAIALVGTLIVAGGIAAAALYREPPQAMRVAERGPSMRAGLREVIRNRNLWVLGAVATLLVTAQLALVAYLALYFSEIVLVPLFPNEHTRIVAAGGFLALCQAGGVAGRVLWGLASDRMLRGRRMPLLALIGAVAGLMALLMGYLAPGFPLWLVSVQVFVYGATALGWNGLYHALIVETAGRKHAAMGVGLCMTLSQAGTVGGPPLFGLVVDLTGSYQTAWLALCCLSVGGALVAALGAREEKQVS